MIVQEQYIKNILSTNFQDKGCSKEIADAISEALIIPEMSGECAHGLRMFNTYMAILHEQNHSQEIRVLKETPAFSVVDCAFQNGLYTAKKCMQRAINRASQYGMHAVYARNANTFGAAFVYGLQAVKGGMIGILMANTPAQMPVYGGNKRMLGTNPICFAIPAKDELPIIFDMASSKVAKSRINNAAEHGEMIPEDWGLDKNGQRTTNPNFLLPFADSPKGYGIAMMIDMFAGLLSGAAYLDEVGFLKSAKMNVGQIFIAIDPKKIYGDDFYAQIDAYIRKVKASGDNVRLPGENKLRNLLRAEKEGFEIDDNLYKQILK